MRTVTDIDLPMHPGRSRSSTDPGCGGGTARPPRNKPHRFLAVLPFITYVLGFNVFDPDEVVLEFTADVGTKKGERVDYAIMANGSPIMLFECKHYGVELSKEPASQLYRYLSVTAARLGVLTDGVTYRLFSDIDEPNKMDQRPFLELNMLEAESIDADELKRSRSPRSTSTGSSTPRRT